jgi:hypothetical protein
MGPALTNRLIVYGYVADNAWNYFHYNAFSTYNLQVQMNQTGTGGDCDLYVKHDTNPTRFDYTYRDISFHQNVTLTIPNPSELTWYLGVYGYRACNYLLMVVDTSQCPTMCQPGQSTCAPCSGHGSCLSDGSCQCQQGYSGVDCSNSLTTITSGQVVNGAVAPNQWVYYVITATTSSLTVNLREDNTTGMAWLYIAQDIYPTGNNYDGSDRVSTSNYHTVHVTPDDDNQPSNWYIGVYGSPYLSSSKTSAWTLTAYATPFKK